MRLFVYLLILSLLFFPLVTKASFVEGLEDIPILEDLEQIKNGNLSFGNEEIRLVETYLTSQSLDFAKVCSFYSETLPQLGWKKKQDEKNRMLFERDGEILELSRESVNPLVVRLTVKSKIQ